MTVAWGKESVIQKVSKGTSDSVKRFQESLGKTAWVTYADTFVAPEAYNAWKYTIVRQSHNKMFDD